MGAKQSERSKTDSEDIRARAGLLALYTQAQPSAVSEVDVTSITRLTFALLVQSSQAKPMSTLTPSGICYVLTPGSVAYVRQVPGSHESTEALAQ